MGVFAVGACNCSLGWMPIWISCRRWLAIGVFVGVHDWVSVWYWVSRALVGYCLYVQLTLRWFVLLAHLWYSSRFYSGGCVCVLCGAVDVRLFWFGFVAVVVPV
jgi:hypothetical protein